MTPCCNSEVIRLGRRGGRRGGAVLQGGQGRQQRRVVAVALPAGAADVLQHFPDGIDQGQQGTGNFGPQKELAVAQPAQQALAAVADLLQPGEAEEAARAFDVVDGAEDTGEPVAVLRVGFQGHEVAVQLLEVLVTLEQEFLDQVLVVHATSPFPDAVPVIDRTAPSQQSGQTPWLNRASEWSEM
jgi:hypothetical protein